MDKRSRLLRFAAPAIAIMLAAALVPPAALADDDGGQAMAPSSALPARFDLRDQGVVGPIRNQNPWGTCWAMAASAASETSILSEQGGGQTFYLSPRHLAWFANSALADAATMTSIASQAPYAAQATEGTTVRSDSTNVYASPLENGGHSFTAACQYAAGMGPVLESDVPYQNNEGIAEVVDTSIDDPDQKGLGTLQHGQTIDEFLALHPGEEFCAFTELDEDGYPQVRRSARVAVTPELAASGSLAFYSADPIFDEAGLFIAEPTADTPAYDWSVPEEQRFSRAYELEECTFLPQTTGGFAGGEFHYNPDAVIAIKQELLAGRGVAASIFDDARDVEGGRSYYTNAENWSQYSVDRDNPGKIVAAAHDICIVGWDDNWSADKFANTTYEDSGEVIWKPPADGAWIVRNSYGADGMGFPNNGNFGYKDADGNHTGYFYLSYYDASISYPASFDFDATGHISAYIDQYDLMPAPVPHTEDYNEPVKAANVFTAESARLVHALSVETEEQNTHVKLQLVRLGGGQDDPVGISAQDDDPLAGEVLATVEADFRYGGYHRLALDEPVRIDEGEGFAVVGELTTVGADGALAYHVPMHRDSNEASIAKYGNSITSYTKAVVNEGESFLARGDGPWNDWSALIAQGHEDGSLVAEIDYDNFALKAYSDEAEEEPEPEPAPALEPEPEPTADTPTVAPASDKAPATPAAPARSKLPATADGAAGGSGAAAAGMAALGTLAVTVVLARRRRMGR